MSALDDEIKALEQKASELSALREDVLSMQSDITMATQTELLKTLNESIDEIVKDNKDKKYFDKDLGETIKAALSNAVAEFAKQKPPEVTFSPTINMDLKPVIVIAEGINKLQTTILQLMQKMEATESGEAKYEALLTLTINMIKQTGEFLQKGLQQVDYSTQLKGIQDAIDKKDRIERVIFNRGDYNLLKDAVPIYKNKD